MEHNINCIHVIKELSSFNCTHPDRNITKSRIKKLFRSIFAVGCTEPFKLCELQDPHKRPNFAPPGPMPPKRVPDQHVYVHVVDDS